LIAAGMVSARWYFFGTPWSQGSPSSDLSPNRLTASGMIGRIIVRWLNLEIDSASGTG